MGPNGHLVRSNIAPTHRAALIADDADAFPSSTRPRTTTPTGHSSEALTQTKGSGVERREHGILRPRYSRGRAPANVALVRRVFAVLPAPDTTGIMNVTICS